MLLFLESHTIEQFLKTYYERAILFNVRYNKSYEKRTIPYYH
jgi:hypothetical protein